MNNREKHVKIPLVALSVVVDIWEYGHHRGDETKQSAAEEGDHRRDEMTPGPGLQLCVYGKRLDRAVRLHNNLKRSIKYQYIDPQHNKCTSTTQ